MLFTTRPLFEKVSGIRKSVWSRTGNVLHSKKEMKLIRDDSKLNYSIFVSLIGIIKLLIYFVCRDNLLCTRINNTYFSILCIIVVINVVGYTILTQNEKGYSLLKTFFY